MRDVESRPVKEVVMNPIRNILVIVDPTADEHAAVVKGALLAEKLDARLELFICDTNAAREARLAAHIRSGASKPLITNVKAVLETIAEPLRARGLDVTTEACYGEPLHVALIDRTQRATAELVIKDTHHHTLAQRTFLTNTDWQLIRGCPAALLLTKSKAWAHAPRVLAAVDPGHVNDKPIMLDHCILEHAAAFAKGLRGELHVVHAYLPLALVTSAATTPPLAISAEDCTRDRQVKFKQVSAIVSDYAVKPDGMHLEMGSPGEVLPRSANALRADVLVMGAISRSGLRRVFIGSTAEDVLERLPCDALVVKTPDFAEFLPL
jgi:universal stress protein E